MNHQVIFLLIISCLSVGSAQDNSWNGQVLKDIPYVENGHSRHKLDLYIPSNLEGSVPCVVFIHGGAWLGGNKGNVQKRVKSLFDDGGYVIADIIYRLSSDSIFPATIYDCKAAIRFLKANSETYSIDPDRIGIIGPSAGGHLAALLGTSINETTLEGEHLGNNEVSSEVHAVFDLYGPTDFLKMDGYYFNNCADTLTHSKSDSPESLVLGCNILECPDHVQTINPITYINGNEPPFSIVHGHEDCLVPAYQSQILHEALLEKGMSSELEILPNAGHGKNFPIDRMQKKILYFFNRHLK